MRSIFQFIGMCALVAMAVIVPAQAEEPRKLHSVVTEVKLVGSDSTLDMYAIDDPKVDGVTCWYTQPKKGGMSNDIMGSVGLNTEISDISLACRQTGPISFADSFESGEQMFTEDRGGFFLSSKEMRIIRVCDPRANTLLYMVYSTKLIDGSPKNSTSTVVIRPWGDEGTVAQCSDAS